MSEAFQRKCPLCGGDLVCSKTSTYGYASYFWKKPWRRGLFGSLGVEKVYPWACMSCGVVLLYLDRLPAIAGEYRKADEAERAPKGYPAVIKP